MTTTISTQFLVACPTQFWEALGVFPDAIRERDNDGVLYGQDKRMLAGLGKGNLRLLCETASVAYPDGADPMVLASTLLDACTDHTPLYLKEVMRSRIPAVEAVYEARFTNKERTAHEAAIRHLSGERETIKVLTKLCMLYRKDSALLAEVYYRGLWQSRATSFQYQSEAKFPADIEGVMRDSSESLRRVLKGANSNRDIRFLNAQVLSDGTVVVVFLREYSPAIKRDFHRDYNLHHICGLIVLGLHPSECRIDIRCGSSRIAEAIANWWSVKFKTTLTLLHGQVFDDYEAEDVTKAFLGEYPIDHGIEMVSVRFQRSSLPSNSALAVEVTSHQRSVREDLRALRDNNSLQFRALSDLDSLVLSYEGQDAPVKVDTDRNGAVRLVFNNAGWDPVVEENFRQAFLKTFGVPLDQLIDPTKLSMGTIGIIGYLLSAKSTEEVRPYQSKTLKSLLDAQVLSQTTESKRVCKNARCDQIGKPCADVNRVQCVKCGNPLQTNNIVRLTPNKESIRVHLDGVFQQAMKWSLKKKERVSEGLAYSPLSSLVTPTNQETIAVLQREQFAESLRFRYERSARPLILLRSQVDGPPVFLDGNGVGHISIAYVLASAGSAVLAEECQQKCKSLVMNLLLDSSRRIAQAAFRSYLRLKEQFSQINNGDEFEVEIFNILRGLFPETVRFGRKGKAEPDGFSGFPRFDNASLRAGRLWTWSYDAKLTGVVGGYDFNSDEYRKVLHYIKKMRRNPELWSDSKRLKAHVLISNDIALSRMKSAANFIYGSDGLDKDDRCEVQLVLMPLAFLLTLFEKVHKHEAEVRRREPHLVEALIKLLTSPNEDQYVFLDPVAAEKLVVEVLARDPVCPEVDEGKLLKTMDSNK